MSLQSAIEHDLGTTSRSPEEIAIPVTGQGETSGWDIGYRQIVTINPSETSTGSFTEDYSLFSAGYNAIKGAVEFAQSSGDQSIAEQASILFETLQRALSQFSILGLDFSSIPQMYARLESGEMLLEWVLPDFRLGFGLETDQSKSSWFLASDEKLGSIGGYGYLFRIDDAKLTKLILWLISFLIQNS